MKLKISLKKKKKYCSIPSKNLKILPLESFILLHFT